MGKKKRQQLNHNLLWQYCVQLCQTAYPDAPRQTVQELLSLHQTSSGLLAVNNTLIFGPSINRAANRYEKNRICYEIWKGI